MRGLRYACIIKQISFQTGVVIGFEAASYSVSESTAEVSVSVAVLSGRLSRDIAVTLQTVDSSALGE